MAALLLTAMLTLPLQTFAEDVELNLKKGEIYNGEWATRIFKGDNAEPFLQSGNVDIFPVDLGTDEFSHNQYKMGPIYCIMSDGTSVIKIQPETKYDEWGNNIGSEVHTITVNVSGNYVTAAGICLFL